MNDYYDDDYDVDDYYDPALAEPTGIKAAPVGVYSGINTIHS